MSSEDIPENAESSVAGSQPIVENPSVAIPTDAEWILIATLQRNPLRPAEFYIFPEENTAINTAYLLGKHFIFEFGSETIERNINRIRHYILQPEPPFQDKHKDALQLHHEEVTGVKDQVHLYTFLSEGWFTPVENVLGVGVGAIGLGVRFELTVFEPRGNFIGEGTIDATQIGLISRPDNPIIGRGRSFINEDVFLRIYVSR